MPNQGWIDYLVVKPTHQGTTEARLDNLIVQPTHQGTTEARLDALAIQPTHQGTTEARLDALNVFVVYTILPPTAIVPDILGVIGSPTQFDGSGSLNAVSYLWTVLSVPGGSATAFPPQALSDNGADGIISMSGNTLLYHCEETVGVTATDTSGTANNGVLQNITLAAAGKVGTYAYDTTNAFPLITPGTVLDMTGDFTFAFWFYDLAPDGPNRVIGSGPTTHPAVLWSSNLLGIWKGGFQSSGFTMVAASYTGWHHMVVVGSGTSTLFYVDGALVGTVADKTVDSMDNFCGHPVSSGQRFADRWDEIDFQTRAVSATEVTNMFNQRGGVGSTFPFTPDVAGTYQVRLTVEGGTGTDTTVASANILASFTFYSPADAVSQLSGSGDVSPYYSNRDASRGLK